ncbi:MAG: glycosyltransferase [Bacteroidota bacterium]|nr:glycosyltransferase [Bacteroidota bacterium]
MADPILSVIMPVYNAEKYLNEAIASILDQDFRDFELIIINDGSTDNSLSILNSFTDERIKTHNNIANKGIVYSRNKGIALSKGKYIGMMDADDVAMPQKFIRQISFLENNKDFGMIGSWVILIDEKGNRLKEKWKLNAKPKEIPAIMLFMNYFVQSAVVFRKEALPAYVYKDGYEIVEDYKLWMDIMANRQAWNLPEYLIKYRIHGASATQSKNRTVEQNLKVVYSELFEGLKFHPNERDLKLHHQLRSGNQIQETETFFEMQDWLEKLLLQNRETKKYPRKIFASVLFNRWAKTIYLTKGISPLKYFHFLFSSIVKEFVITRL